MINYKKEENIVSKVSEWKILQRFNFWGTSYKELNIRLEDKKVPNIYLRIRDNELEKKLASSKEIWFKGTINFSPLFFPMLSGELLIDHNKYKIYYQNGRLVRISEYN